MQILLASSQFLDGQLHGSYPETGFGEKCGDVREPDLNEAARRRTLRVR
jgi:hypothetical protein